MPFSLGNLGQFWATFYLNIWSHWLWSLRCRHAMYRSWTKKVTEGGGDITYYLPTYCVTHICSTNHVTEEFKINKYFLVDRIPLEQYCTLSKIIVLVSCKLQAPDLLPKNFIPVIDGNTWRRHFLDLLLSIFLTWELSVTRFGEISPLWHSVKKLWPF